MTDAKTEKSDYNAEDDIDRKDRIKLAADLVQTLSKSGKTLKIYPETSPVRQKIIDELNEKFAKFLNQCGELDLRIRQFEITYNDEVIYSNPSKEESLAFKFYGDGIRSIRFTVGLEEKEILDFIGIISRNYSLDAQDNDIITMLWEKNFENIHHTAVDYREEREIETIAPEDYIPSESGSGNLQSVFNAEVSKHTADTGDDGETTLQAAAGAELVIEAIYKKPISEIFILTQEEIEQIQQEMETEEGMDLVSELLDILFHILQIEKELDIYTEILKNITDTLKTFILSGDYQRGLPILTTLKALSNEENNFSPVHAQEVYSAIDSLGVEQFIRQLTTSININKLIDTTQLFSFLTMLNKNAIESISNMTGTIEQIKIRRLYCDVLALLARDNMELLIKGLEDSNWYVVRNIVYVLGKIGSAEAIKYLRRIKNHSEPKVRKEIVHAVSEINSDDAKDLLSYYLDDKDSSVRLTALQNIAIHGYRKAVPSILNIIIGENFDIKDVSEKRDIFETLGILNSTQSLPYLKNLLMKRAGFFSKSRIEEQRSYAALALKKMSIPEAKDILTEGLLHPDRSIRNICEETLKDMEKEQR